MRLRLGLTRLKEARLDVLGMAPLFQCSAADGAKRLRDEEGNGRQRGPASSQGTATGGSKYGLTAAQVEELAVRSAQVLSLHDVRLRELGTVLRKVKMPVNSQYGQGLVRVDLQWKSVRTGGGKNEGSKHLRLASTVLEALYQSAPQGELKELLQKRWTNKDTSTPEFLGSDVRVMKWKTLKNGKDGVLEFMLVPELAVVEQELLRVLVAQAGAVELFGTETKGPQIREVEEMIEGTWGRR